ncbi:hypothetical protein SDC9_42932 [bioreactor metagenome]|jgi:1-acyl-sn-glycerol-3-phosphate acyltransferase|uniref:Phospholipid/glycerol acyltransferase domain-containing protein n=1 Tax=bioreactor metagenome TaxID=1076179 RepID=A0A644W014_9ZZZZ|nr:1-acyl-sn-glycerol-3-phosphate acyltransferase [Paludibacter sp.]
MSKIFENTLPYLIAKSYVVWSFKQYYDEIIILGLENIPKDEPVIFAPNHLNALMDALAILSLPPCKQPKVFLSRSDVFKLPEPVVKFIRFAKIMPAYRIRDGYENLTKNKNTFEAADEVLLHNAAICIMPEGDQGTERKIRPLVKGIFRIAFSAQQRLPEGKSVNIIPVGIDLGDFIRFGQHLIIQIGKPIKVTDYLDSYIESQAVATNAIKQKLQTDLEDLALHLGSEKHYDCFATAVETTNTAMIKALALKDNTSNRFLARKKLGKLLMRLEKEEPEVTEQLDSACKKYKSELQKVKISHNILERSIPSKFKVIINSIIILFSLIPALPGFILNGLPFILSSQVPNILKIEFKGFYSSVFYGSGIILFPLFYILQSVIFILAFALPWWFVFILIPLHYLTGKIAFRFYRIVKSAYSDLKLYSVSKKQPNELKTLQKLRQQITEILITRAF